MAKLGDLVVRIGANTKGFNAKLGALKSQIRKDTKNIAAMGRNMSMGITAPLVAIGATSFKVAADFEQSMAKVKAVSGATGDEFKKLQDNAKELGRTTRFTASEVSALQLEYAKLGFSADEITQVTGATLNLAQATGSDLAQSAEVAGATLRAFGLDASETGRVTDVMAASFSTSALDLDSFQDSMKFVAPVAKAAGVSLEEATAMLGQLANNGIKGSNAGTSLRRILQEVAGTGQPFSEAMKKSADEVINLADAKDEVGRTASSAFLVLKEGMGDVAGLTTELQHAEGAAAGMAAIMDDTAQGAMKRMQSAVEGAQIEIGAALAPTMIKLAGIVGNAAQKFTEMSDGGKAVIFAISGIAGAIGPMLMVLPGLVKGIKLAKLAMASLNFTMLANPFVLAATAIMGVVGAVALLYSGATDAEKEVQKLRDELDGLDQDEGARVAAARIEAQREAIEQQRTAVEALRKTSQMGDAIERRMHTQSLMRHREELAAMEEVLEGFIQIQREQHTAGERSAVANKKTVTGMLGVLNSYGKAKETVKELNEETGKTEVTTRKLENTLGFLINTLEEVPNEQIWQPIDQGAKETTQTLGNLMTMLESVPAVLSPAQEQLNELFTETREQIELSIEKAENFGSSLGSTFSDLINKNMEVKTALEEGLISPLEAAEQKSANAKESIKGFVRDAILALIKMAKINVIANATSPANAANLATGGLATPAFIIAGLSMLEGFLGGITAFADGGIVSGPTMGLVGEYPGAKTNPEVIAPLDKLRSMMGGQNVVVTGRLSGRDILLSSEMSNIDRNRVRGF